MIINYSAGGGIDLYTPIYELGSSDIIPATGGLVIFELPYQKVQGQLPVWPMFHHDVKNSGFYSNPYIFSSYKLGQINGDVNGDGIVTFEDADIIQFSTLAPNIPPENICCIDANQDGEVTIADVVIIENIAGGNAQSPGMCPCNDGTPHEQCSSTRPIYCEQGELIDNCSACGCPVGQSSCREDGSCIAQCQDGIDNDEDTFIDYPSDPGCESILDNDEADCGNGVCQGIENREDCNVCSEDCMSGTYYNYSCGDGICDKYEDCVTCSSDCAGTESSGAHITSDEYCCGRTTCDSKKCGEYCGTEGFPLNYCCGDGKCQGQETSDNCEVDC